MIIPFNARKVDACAMKMETLLCAAFDAAGKDVTLTAVTMVAIGTALLTGQKYSIEDVHQLVTKMANEPIG